MSEVTPATALQNRWATDGPSTVPTGTTGLAVRFPSVQLSGALQTSFVFGPVGPLLKLASRCPQCPV